MASSYAYLVLVHDTFLYITVYFRVSSTCTLAVHSFLYRRTDYYWLYLMHVNNMDAFVLEGLLDVAPIENWGVSS